MVMGVSESTRGPESGPSQGRGGSAPPVFRQADMDSFLDEIGWNGPVDVDPQIWRHRDPLAYHDFKADLRFDEVAMEVDADARREFELTGRRVFWTRATVLGRMRELKLQAYRRYLRQHHEYWDGLPF